MTNFGLQLTEMDGTEHVFGDGMEIASLPEKYSYKNFLPEVLDQGTDPICVPCSVSAFLNWKENLEEGKKVDNKIDYFEIYNYRQGKGDGMTFKEALQYLRHHGVKSKAGKLTINEYAVIKSTFALKLALVANGPCLGALPVYNYTDKFWQKMYGDTIQGYHAISIVGYDEKGFIIRNSWGNSFGKNGYTSISEEEIGKFLELWTIVS